MSISIITDSASDISQVDAEKLNVKVLPLHVRFGDEEFLDGVTLSNSEFYNKLIETDICPKTSQISPYDYKEAFEEGLQSNSDVICLTLSSEVSGCYQSACLAKNMLDDDEHIHIIDTRQFCISQYILAEYASILASVGKDADFIVDEIERLKEKVHVIAVFDTLEYLKLGGRISSAAASMGNLLSIKPVITITDGAVDVIGKARGSKKAGNMLNQFIDSHGNISKLHPFIFAYSGFSDDALRKYLADCGPIYGLESVDDSRIVKVGAAIGTYAGPGAFAFAYFEK